MASPSEYEYEIAVGDFDKALLPPHARTPGTDAFRAEVTRVLEADFANFGGWVRIIVSDEIINVAWRPDPNRPDPLETAVQRLRAGNYAEGIRLLELLGRADPDNADVLYNLGMALSDQGQLDRALAMPDTPMRCSSGMGRRAAERKRIR